MSSPTFLTLPQEIRDMIYRQCLFEPDGYHFDHHLKAFRTSTGSLVDTSLQYVCKQISAEIGHTALSMNTLNFSTVPCKDISSTTAKFEYLVDLDTRAKVHAIKVLALDKMAQYMTPDVHAKLEKMHPQLAHLVQFKRDDPAYDPKGVMEHVVRDWDYTYWGRAQSESLSFMDTTIETLLAVPELRTALGQTDKISWGTDGERDLSPVSHPEMLYFYQVFARQQQLLSSLKPWAMPSDEAFQEFMPGIALYPWIFDECFSAAAAAISYMHGLSKPARCAIRKVILHEDRAAVASPECHGVGFVPLCQENHRLKITRRVDFWEYVDPDRVYSIGIPDDFHRIKQTRAPGVARDWHMEGYAATDISVADWIIEASYLSTAGMPPGSFSLLFDGGQRLNDAREVFELVKWDAAWQQAWTEWNAARSLRYDRIERASHQSFQYDDLPKAIDEIVEGRSLISCNFPVGQLVDVRLLFPEIDRYTRSRQ